MHDGGVVLRGSLRRVGIVLGAIALIIAFLSMPASADTDGTIAVCLTDSEGNNVVLGGDQAWYRIGAGSILYVGAVGDSGCREQAVPGGSLVTVWVAKDGTVSHKITRTVPAGGTETVDFYTTKVTIQYPGSVAFGGELGNSGWFKKPSMELLSNGVNPTMFRLDTGSTPSARLPLSWPAATGTGEAITKSMVALRVQTNAGDPIAGASLRYGLPPGNCCLTHGPVSDANGMIGYAVNGLLTDSFNEVTVNGTKKALVHDASAQKVQVFQTTNVSIAYTGSFRYYYQQTPTSGGAHFSKPSMELFSGTYDFQFHVPDTVFGSAKATYSNRVPITVGDTPVVKTAVVARLQDSSGNGLVGDVAYYRGGWHDGGQTHPPSTNGKVGGNGTAAIIFDGKPTNVTFAMTYEGGRQQLAKQNIQTNSFARFYTTPITLELIDDDEAALGEGGSAAYYASGWRTFGDTDTGGTVTKELLPVSYSFAMTYQGSRQQISKTTDQTVTFQTGEIQSCGTATSYYASGWRTFSEGLQLLPSKVSFHFNDGRPMLTMNIVAGAVNNICP